MQCCLDASLPLKSSHGLFGFVAWPSEQMIPRVQRWARLRHRLLLCEKRTLVDLLCYSHWLEHYCHGNPCRVSQSEPRTTQRLFNIAYRLPFIPPLIAPRLSPLLHHPPSNPSSVLRPSKSWREAKSLEWAGNPQGGASVTPPWKAWLWLQFCFCDIAASSW